MLWLTWQMWILLALALLIGAIVGWMARARSDEAEKSDAAGGSAGVPAKAPAMTASKPAGDTPKAAAGSTPPTPQPAKKEAPKPKAKPAAVKAAEGPARSKPADVPSHARGETSQGSKSGPGPVAVGPAAPAAPGSSATGSGREKRDTKTAGTGEDLTQIRGLGPKAAEKLREAGVTTIADISRWSKDDIERYDTLISGRGRIVRDDWVGQARDIVKG